MTTDYVLKGMHVTDYSIDVPLDWAHPESGRTIRLFAREVVDPARRREELPVLVFLQGGPGGKSPRPIPGKGWIADVIKTHRLVLVDQRGTGRSSRVQASTLADMTPQEAVSYLLCFRADSIVADLEELRKKIYGGVRWETLGQSYGGFITLAYLSRHPEALAGCYVAGGLTSIEPLAEDVYRHTYPRVAKRMAEYYRTFPGDLEVVRRVCEILESERVVLPDGDPLTVRRFQTIGLDLGLSGGLERAHWLLDDALEDDALTDSFLAQVAALTSFDDNPLFVVMQESLYGNGLGATRWAADRVLAEFPQFEPTARPLLFTGEMMHPWMLDEIRSLRGFASAAEALAEHEDYTQLYDAKRLAANDVPLAAIAYFEDIFVDVEYCVETAARVGNCQLWVTNQYEHDGISQDANIVTRLMEMVAQSGGPRR